jgi:predicted nuclease with TOPRIM domain
VEEAAVVTDFGGALLIHRTQVAELNGQVRQLGREKVGILREIRDFRKGIVMLEWENQRADMEMTDLVERTKEFQLLRVTKDLQGKIRGGAEDDQAAEAASLEKKLEQLQAAHADKIADLRRQCAKINAMIAERNDEMESLQGQIEQLEGSVLEREMIHEIQSQSKDATGDGFKRFEEINMKRKLQTLVGMQAQEIGLLRDELDRLRRRTFPTFTHIDSGASADRAL